MSELSEDGNVGYELEPASGIADSVCIMLHGYGADGADMIDVAAEMSTFLPNTHFVAPNAPEPCLTAPGFYQWYAIEHGAAGADMTAEYLAPKINQYADEQLERLGLDNSQLIMMGFSQGGGIVMEAAFRRHTPCGALLLYTATLCNEYRLDEVIKVRPPVMMIHGELDDVIPAEKVQETVNTLQAHDVPVRQHICPGLGHSLNEEGALVGAMFIADILYS